MRNHECLDRGTARALGIVLLPPSGTLILEIDTMAWLPQTCFGLQSNSLDDITLLFPP
ncbi:MAG TPA: hypothetical protein PK360_10090 [bacterium]|nr:hypothetical protein [bacterium]